MQVLSPRLTRNCDFGKETKNESSVVIARAFTFEATNVSFLGVSMHALARLIERPSSLLFSAILLLLGVGGYVFSVRLPSVGFNAHLYSAFGTYVNTTGGLPVEGQYIGSEPFAASYGDFPAINLIIYRLLAMSGEEPNRFVWASYFIFPVVIASIALARFGGRLGLPLATARLTALTSIFLGSLVARGYEDKGHFFWLIVAVMFAASVNPLMGAIWGGVLAGWTGLAPLA